MRVVADTNIVISGLLWHGPPASFLDQALDRTFSLFGTEELLDELRVVLCRPKFAARLNSRGRDPAELVAAYREIVTLVKPAAVTAPEQLRDLKDIPVLRCAVAAHAHAIVSGDRHLLELKAFRGISVVTPRVFLAAIGS
ncbi:MAG: putative toxin-antitoxin system toxin component, PIN family [Lentisphaerae bacterium]|nr:putative toxin-antitoxin system toxin component, PIN family [Lentisphaerota bacterium]